MSILTPFSEHQEHLNSHIGAYLFNRSFTRKTIAALLVVSIALASYYALNSKLDTLHVQAASTDPRTATSTSDCVNDSGIGTLAWSDPGNASTIGSGAASVEAEATTTTQYLKCTNFGFSEIIPAGQVINGIEVFVAKDTEGLISVTDNAVRIIKDGTIGDADRSNPQGVWGGDVYTHGGPVDLWGESWSISDIESSDFGVAISATLTVFPWLPSGGAEIDYIQIAVHYSPPPPTLSQSAYRFYQNADSTDVGNPIASLNTPANLSSAGQEFRLRVLVHAATNPWSTGGELALQYVDPGTGNCSAPDGGTPADWTDVTRNGIANIWSEITPITGSTTGSWGDLAYLDSTFFFYTNNRFYTSTDGATWTTQSSFSHSRTAVVAFDDKVWAIGGSTGGFPTTMSSQVHYTTDGSNYTQATADAGWTPRTEHKAVVFDGKLWIAGGRDGDGNVLNDVWYSSDGVNWTQASASASWAARRDFGFAAMNGKLWIAGGRGSTSGGSTLMDDVWYSSDGVTWTQATDNADWGVRRGMELVGLDGKLVLLGGGINNNGDSGQADVWISEDGSDWELATDSPGWGSRLDHGVVVVDGVVWLTGGASNKEVWHTSNPTLIAFNDNASPSSGSELSPNANDPTHSADTVVAQTYNEGNPASIENLVSVGQDGMWDFSLIDTGAPASATYCFRLIHSLSGTELDAYTLYPSITTFSGAAPTPQMEQRLRGGNWWNGGVRQFLILD